LLASVPPERRVAVRHETPWTVARRARTAHRRPATRAMLRMALRSAQVRRKRRGAAWKPKAGAQMG